MLNPIPVAADRIARLIETRGAHVGVIGLGAVGGVSARLIAASGFRVTGVDRSETRLAQLRLLPEYREIALAPDVTALAAADVIFVAVRVASGEGNLDLEPARDALTAIRDHARQLPLILFECTVPPGTTRALADEIFGAGSAQQALVAHCPERLRVGDDIDAIRATPRLIGGLGDIATTLGAAFLRRLGIEPVCLSSPEVSELSKLLENAFLTTGIALMGEVTRIAHRLEISAQEVAAAAATKTHGYFAFRPGAGIGGHCLINDLQMLRGAAADAGVASLLLEGVRDAAGRLTDTVVGRLEELLQARHMPLDGAQVCIVGVGFKPDSPDVTNSAAIDLVRALRTRGARVGYIDSLVENFAVDGAALPRWNAQSAAASQALLLLGGDRATDIRALAARVPATLDASGRGLLGRQEHAFAL